ncbi:MAG: AMP-binding protein, partial [Pseudomonadota bacterium]
MPRDVGSPDILTLSGLLAERAAHVPDADALIFPDTRYTYGELYERARFWAKAFVGLGVRPKDHVGLLLHTCPEFVEAMFGAALAGAVVAPINARYVGGELRYVTENADLATIVTTGAIADAVNFVERLNDAFP